MADDKKVDVSKFPHHMQVDYIRRNGNIDEGNKLCPRCNGTGNELMSMYRTCSACRGDGVYSPFYDYTKD